MNQLLKDILKTVVAFVPLAQMLDVATTYYALSLTFTNNTGAVVRAFNENNARFAPHMANITFIVGVKMLFGVLAFAGFYTLFFIVWKNNKFIDRHPVIPVFVAAMITYISMFPIVTNLAGIFLYHLVFP